MKPRVGYSLGNRQPNSVGNSEKSDEGDDCREVLAQLVPNDAKGRTHAQAIAETLASKAVGGDIAAAKELADRAEGKPRQSLEIEHARLGEAFDRTSSEELET